MSIGILYEYCVTLYQTMEQQARVEHDENNETSVVWEGFLTKLVVDELGHSIPYYTKLKNELIRMDCIKQLRRGGSTTPSKWLLIQSPTQELFTQMVKKNTPPKQSTQAGMQQQINDLNRRMSEMEQRWEELLSNG